MNRIRAARNLLPTRRGFLRGTLLLIAPLALSFVPVPVAAWARLPGDSGGPRIDVRDKGALGDGRHDDTAAIQAAIDALPASGGTVSIPDGNYMVDALRSINLRSNTRLQMTPAATLRAIANDSTHSYVIKVWRADNVQIIGGRVVGERDGHLGTTGEWGFGISIQASNNVSVIGTHISDCWGDGIWIGGLGKHASVVVSTGVTLDHVVSTNNRRQALSIGPVRGVRVIHSTFSNTHGTKPQDGIDIEPQGQGPASDIVFSDCTITGNLGSGLELSKNVSGVVLKHCRVQGNSGYGVLARDTSQLTIADNVITDNGLTGVMMRATASDVSITGNTLTGNSARYLRRFISSISSLRAGDRTLNLRVDQDARNVTVSGNKFQP
ncbi:right-handed parallel beta-helix repeat-containing protein [Rhodanobacter umsongensis]|uniref:Right-handed parallel beta-helix repeat-containing protein n=1 Tax=Rhodanobacter umsongensis TaxID=633153 RepID=A0ABW0JK96_9GAMM